MGLLIDRIAAIDAPSESEDDSSADPISAGPLSRQRSSELLYRHIENAGVVPAGASPKHVHALMRRVSHEAAAPAEAQDPRLVGAIKWFNFRNGFGACPYSDEMH